MRDRCRNQRPDRGQGALRLGNPVHLLRGERRHRRELVLRQSERALLGLPVAPHRHLARRRLLPRHADGAGRVPGLSAPLPDPGLPAPLCRRVLAARSDPLRDTGRACRAARGRWLEDHAGRRLDPGIRLPDRRQRPPLGSSLPRLPRELRRGDAPLSPLHRAERAARPLRQAGARRRHREQRGRHRLRALPQGHGREGVSLHAQRRLGDAQVLPRPPPRHAGQDQPAAASEPAAADGAAPAPPRLRADGGLRSPPPQPQVHGGPPDRLQRAAPQARLRGRGRQAECSGAGGRLRSDSRTAPRRRST